MKDCDARKSAPSDRDPYYTCIVPHFALSSSPVRSMLLSLSFLVAKTLNDRTTMRVSQFCTIFATAIRCTRGCDHSQSFQRASKLL
eukprot:3700049-Amphidinium_carterae.1